MKTTKRTRPRRTPRGTKRRTLPALTAADLADSARLDALYRLAVASGIIDGSERRRVDFHEAAAQARMKGNDPVRLFSWIVNGGHWHVLTDEADDAARRMLRPTREKPASRAESVTYANGVSVLVYRAQAVEPKQIGDVLAKILK